MATAFDASPIMIGTMCAPASPNAWIPEPWSIRVMRIAFARRRSRRVGSALMIRSASRAAAACAGIIAVVNTNDLASQVGKFSKMRVFTRTGDRTRRCSGEPRGCGARHRGTAAQVSTA